MRHIDLTDQKITMMSFSLRNGYVTWVDMDTKIVVQDKGICTDCMPMTDALESIIRICTLKPKISWFHGYQLCSYCGDSYLGTATRFSPALVPNLI